ncbi:MAG: response regulator, partial [Candidatus Omnitrophota bacterium]
MLKHKIMLVDDEQNILSSISRLLRQDDREIYTASDANEAWDKLKSIAGADLIISDNKLPTI